MPEQHSYMYATSITAQAVVLEAEEGGMGGEYEYDWVYMWLHALHARTYTAFLHQFVWTMAYTAHNAVCTVIRVPKLHSCSEIEHAETCTVSTINDAYVMSE